MHFESWVNVLVMLYSPSKGHHWTTSYSENAYKFLMFSFENMLLVLFSPFWWKGRWVDSLWPSVNFCQHCFRLWCVSWRQQLRIFVSWTLKNQFQWNFNQNADIFFQAKTFGNVVFKLLIILSRPQCVNMWFIVTFKCVKKLSLLDQILLYNICNCIAQPNNKIKPEYIFPGGHCPENITNTHHSISQPPVHSCFARAIELIAHPNITPILSFSWGISSKLAFRTP